MTPLVPDAIDANRTGKLTDAQRRSWRAMSGGVRKGELQFAALLTVAGLVVWFAPGPPQYAVTKPLIGVACLIIAGFLLVRSFLGADSLTVDVRTGRVESVEGAVSKWTNTVHGRNHSTTTHYIQVEKVRVETNAGAYQAVPEAGIVRMYYLPRSLNLVNLEQLADLPLPAGALTDPKVVMNEAKQAFAGSLFGDQAKAAEARAEIAAIGHAMQAQMAGAATPPPAADRDPRPLAEAIVGTWKNLMMSVTFAPDGTVSTQMPGGMSRSGTWSVDSSGRLVSDITGTPGAIDAWVAGDHLTVTLEGRGLQFQKQP